MVAGSVAPKVAQLVCCSAVRLVGMLGEYLAEHWAGLRVVSTVDLKADLRVDDWVGQTAAHLAALKVAK